jgi:hypothetical protein
MQNGWPFVMIDERLIDERLSRCLRKIPLAKWFAVW